MTIDNINHSDERAVASISEFKRRQEAAAIAQIELSKAKSSEMEKVLF